MAASCLLCWEDKKKLALVPCDVMPCAVKGDNDLLGILALCLTENRSLPSLVIE